MVFGAVGTVIDDFGGGLPRDGVVEFILNHGVEVMGNGSVFIVVDAALCEDIRYLLPDAAFAGTDRADALKQLTEVVVTKRSCSLFEAFVIQREALGHILLQDAGRPDAELCRAAGIDAVADGDNRIQIIINNGTGNVAVAFLLNYFHFGKSCVS